MTRINRGESIAIIIILLQMLFSTALAQERNSFTIGTFHSPKGFGACAEFPIDSASFNAFTVIADMHGVLTGEHPRPGVKMTYTRDIVIKHFDKDGYTVDMYAGPGLTAGYARDIKKPYSIIGGLACVAGSRFSFSTKLIVNIEVCADIALDLTRNPRNGNINLSIYKSGIYHTIFPQLRIQYVL
ncbi:MAG: hypothetical protein Q4G10_03225 [Bacteroidia bacterium]|nr:hypothetical protein [Bacteroidia bacterium]